MSKSDTSMRVVRVSVSGLTLGLDMSRVYGIERADRLQLSNDDSGLVGIFSNRSGEWPTLDLASILGQTPKENPRSGKIILIERSGERCGLLVDRAVSNSSLEQVRLLPVPAVLQRRQIFTGVLLDPDPVLMLNLDRLEAIFESEPEPIETPRRQALHAELSSSEKSVNRLLIVGQVPASPNRTREIGFGLPVNRIAEIADAGPGTVVPGASSQLHELVAWRKQAIPVFDLAAWCGLEGIGRVNGAVRRIVVLRSTSREPIAVLAGRSARMINLPVAHVPLRHPIPLRSQRILGAFDLNDISLVVPDLAQLTGR